MEEELRRYLAQRGICEQTVRMMESDKVSLKWCVRVFPRAYHISG